MKSILMSIQPKWCEKIINGEKTVEVRKTAPKEVPFKVYIYCTKGKKGVLYKAKSGITLGYKNDYMRQTIIEVLNERGYRTFNGKVIGEFIVKTAERYEIDEAGIETNRLTSFDEIEVVIKNSCLNIQELRVYAKDKPIYAWHISDLKVYDKPKEIGEFKKEYKYDIFMSEKGIWKRMKQIDYTIKKAPQNYIFIQEV